MPPRAVADGLTRAAAGDVPRLQYGDVPRSQAIGSRSISSNLARTASGCTVSREDRGRQDQKARRLRLLAILADFEIPDHELVAKLDVRQRGDICTKRRRAIVQWAVNKESNGGFRYLCEMLGSSFKRGQRRRGRGEEGPRFCPLLAASCIAAAA